jgi:hypothetical protein
MRIRWLIVLGLLICGPADANVRLHGSGVPTAQFGTLKVGGGGFVTNCDMTSDGTKLCRTDTYGDYLLVGGLWQQLVTISSMPAADANADNYSGGIGVYEARIAPSNTSHFYMMLNGYVFSSTNKGGNWTRTAFTQDLTFNTSDGFRTNGRYMAVDPMNELIVYAGTPTALSVTLNGGTSFGTVSSVTAPTDTLHGGVLVAFDPSSSVISNVTQGIYACSPGNGVFHSTNGGTSFTKITGTPTTCGDLLVDAAGLVWLVDTGGGGGNLWKLSGSTWTEPITSGTIGGVAVNPADGTKVYAVDNSTRLYVSTDTGVSFVGPTSQSAAATDIPWLVQASVDGYNPGNILFDPAGSNLLYMPSGIGVFHTNPPTTNTAIVWTSQTAGIENLDMNVVVGIASGKPAIAAWDRAGFVITPGTYPSSYGGVECSNQLPSGWGIAVDPTGTQVAVAGTPANAGCGNGAQTAISPVSWSLFTSQTPGQNRGGCMAASSTTNLLWLPKDAGSNSNGPWTTTNGGLTWTLQTVGTVPTSGTTGWGQNYYEDTIYCAADLIDSSTYYIYNDGAAGSGSQGIWKSTDNGVTWAQVSTINFGGFAGATQIKTVPGQSGNLFASPGNGGTASAASHPAALSLYQSVNHGAAWNAIANVLETFCVGFGKPASGQTYPTVFFIGWAAGTPSTVTFSNGSAVISATNSFTVGQAVKFTTTGSLPTNFNTSTIYYVISTSLSSSQFEVATSKGGTAVTAGSAGSGTQSMVPYPFGAWKSVNNFATAPVQVGNGYPGGSFDPIKDCYGEMGTVGTMYMVTGGNGAYQGTGL